MFSIRIIIASFLSIFISINYAVADISRGLAIEAYHQLEGNVFNSYEINSALQKLNKAGSKNNKEPWVYITASLVHLIYGYKIGDWYEMDTFNEGSVNKALIAAEQALSLGPKESGAYAQLARVQIIRREFEVAQELLDKAYKIDPNNFYPWYYRGILAEKKRDVANADKYFAEALERVEYPYQKEIVNIHQQAVARIKRDCREQENLLKKNIANNPTSPYMHGNYASFLMHHKRYSEAITYWQKAIELGSYRHAEEQLEKTKMLAKKALEEREDVQGVH